MLKSGDPLEPNADGDGKLERCESVAPPPLKRSSERMSEIEGDLSPEALAALVARVDAEPLTKGEDERRDEDALLGAVSIEGTCGMARWARFEYAVDVTGLFTGFA